MLTLLIHYVNILNYETNTQRGWQVMRLVTKQIRDQMWDEA